MAGTPSSKSSSDNQRTTESSNVQNDISQQPQSFSKSFQFVAENDPDPRKTVRKHVMKEFQRERRFQRDVTGKTEPQPKRKRSKAQRKTTGDSEEQAGTVSGLQ